MEETFPHHYEDGYVITDLFSTGWNGISYNGIYKNTKSMPAEWNTLIKKHKLVAQFVRSQWRCEIVYDKKCRFGCELQYKYSSN